jgi:hypothetical protein
MGAAWYRARSELRRRWRATLVLVALVGLAGGVLLTTVAGARRSSSAYERFRVETLAADLDIAFDGPPGGDLEATKAAVAALPQVTALTQTAFPFIVPAGSGFYPYLDFLAVVGTDASFGRDVDRPRLLAGRIPDPSDPTEGAIVETFAREADLAVGDEVAFESFAPEQLEPLFTTGDAGPPAGPRTTLVVTGIVDAPTFLSESTGSFVPRVFLSPAFLDRYGEDMATYPGGFAVRLRNGATDVPAVTSALREIFPPETMLELTPSQEIDRKIESSIDIIVTALVLCALAAGLAGCVAVGQALTRHLSADATTERALAAMGMSEGERALSRLATAIPVAIGGAALAVVVAILASPLMPVGVARRAEPDPGVDVDPLVLGLGSLGVLVTIGVLALLASIVAGRRTRLAADRPSARADRSLLSRRTGLSPVASVGTSMALEPRAGTAWAVRSALVAVAFGITGVVAVGVFAASAGVLVDSPDRYGSPFDATISGFSGDVLAEGGDALLADADVEQMGALASALARIGDDELPTYSLVSLKGGISMTLLSGRLPRAAGEVVLGTSTLDDAGAAVGDEVELVGISDALEATVVGKAVFPVVDERSGAGRGALLLPDDLERISSPDEVNNDVVITWADGVDVERANAALAGATETEVFTPRLPSDVNNLREVQPLPRALALFLAVLATLAAVHALVSTVRLRRQELAVLRVLGFERRQVAATLGWQATTIGLIGLSVGIPLGVVVGRAVWRAVASGIGVVDDPVTPGVGVLLVAIAALAIVNLAAIVPGRAARRVRPAAVLRSG